MILDIVLEVILVILSIICFLFSKGASNSSQTGPPKISPPKLEHERPRGSSRPHSEYQIMEEARSKLASQIGRQITGSASALVESRCSCEGSFVGLDQCKSWSRGWS